MKRHWVCLQLRFEAPKDFNLAMALRRAALSGNASSMSSFLVVIILIIIMRYLRLVANYRTGSQRVVLQ